MEIKYAQLIEAVRVGGTSETHLSSEKFTFDFDDEFLVIESKREGSDEVIITPLSNIKFLSVVREKKKNNAKSGK